MQDRAVDPFDFPGIQRIEDQLVTPTTSRVEEGLEQAEGTLHSEVGLAGRSRIANLSIRPEESDRPPTARLELVVVLELSL